MRMSVRFILPPTLDMRASNNPEEEVPSYEKVSDTLSKSESSNKITTSGSK